MLNLLYENLSFLAIATAFLVGDRWAWRSAKPYNLLQPLPHPLLPEQISPEDWKNTPENVKRVVESLFASAALAEGKKQKRLEAEREYHALQQQSIKKPLLKSEHRYRQMI